MPMRFFISIGFVIVSLVGGCASENKTSRDVTIQMSNTAQEISSLPTTAPVEPEVAIDQIVIETVLVDLLEYQNENSPRPRSGEIYFDNKTATRVIRHYIISRGESYKKEWDALSTSQQEGATDAAAQIGKRLESGDGFAAFVPRDSRVKPYIPPATKPSPYPYWWEANHLYPVRAAPPGFSADGRYSAVYLWLPWGAHGGGCATYILERDDNGAWRVIYREAWFFV